MLAFQAGSLTEGVCLPPVPLLTLRMYRCAGTPPIPLLTLRVYAL